MATRKNKSQVRARKETQIILKDLNAKPIFSVGLFEYTIRDSSGAILRRNINESFQLVSNVALFVDNHD